jgi:hypothetical protein
VGLIAAYEIEDPSEFSAASHRTRYKVDPLLPPAFYMISVELALFNLRVMAPKFMLNIASEHLMI